MDIFKKLFQPQLLLKEVKLPNVSSIISMPRFGLSNRKNDETYLKEYKNWVYACIDARASELASIELYVENDRTKESSDTHELLTLLDDVNPSMTRYQLFYATQAFLDLTGNAYWYLARDNDGKGKVKQIYIISPDQMNIVVDKENPLTIKGYVYGTKGNEVPFEANEVLHFKKFNPSGRFPNPHKGVGIVESALWAIETDNEARNWNYSFFKNSARPDGLLTTETALSDTQFKRVQDQWKQKHQGSDNNGKTAILEGGLKWQDVSKTQKDMDFVAQRTFSRDEILALFRVPRTVIGITDDVNRANAEASDYVFARRTVKPMMKEFITMLNEYLMPEYSTDFKLEFKDPVPEDRLATITAYTSGINKWLTRNDIRRKEGLEPSQSGDTFYAPFSESPQDTVNTPVKGKIASKTQVKSQDDVIDDFIAKLPKKKKEFRKLKDSQKSIFKEIYLKRFDENEKKLITELKKYFNNQEQEVINNLEAEFNGLKPKEYKLKGVKDVIFDEPKAIATGINLMTPFLKEFLKQGAEMADSNTGGEYNPNDVDSLNFIKARAEFFSKSINETTKNALLASIDEGVKNGEDFADLRKRIEDIYKTADQVRIDTIARTEVSASLTEGGKQAYLQEGLSHWEWLAVDPCDDCVQNDGQVVEIGKAFPSGIEQPPQHCNCRCSTVGVFVD
jgi:HK97 family phage portal protein